MTLQEENKRWLENYLKTISENICPVCKVKMEDREQKGHCVYAVPCGHRLYQGQIPKANEER